MGSADPRACDTSFAELYLFSGFDGAAPDDAQALLREAAVRMMALEFLSFVLEHQTGSTELFPGVEMTRVGGGAEGPSQPESSTLS